MRVLICGDRNWTDEAMIYDWLRTHRADISVVIEGECRGADSLARIAAEYLRIEVLPFPAEWSRYGKSAGPVRNTEMLHKGRPDLVVAFHDSIATSKGTRDMLRQAREANVPVEVVSHSCS